MTARLLPIALLALMTGCGPSTRTYSVTVQNQAAVPMTVWLTKDGGPIEPDWASPEELAMYGKVKDASVPGVVIPPGKTGVMDERKGKFDGGTNAVLRVYRGQRLFNDILATRRDSPERTDVRLEPGANTIIIDATGTPTRK